MRIELKQNRIVVVLTEAETNFLTHKATLSGQKDVISYIRAKLLESLELKGFEDSAIVNLVNNFDLAKIKDVSTELSQRKTGSGTYSPEESKSGSDDDEDLIEDLLNEHMDDDLLSDLLDKDLLKGRKKPQKSPKPGKIED